MPPCLFLHGDYSQRPEPRSAHLVPWLAELSWRECLRSAPVSGLCLRFGRIVGAEEIAANPYDPRWLHLDDAVSGLRRALDYFAAPRPQQQSPRAISKLKGYTGDECPDCGNFTMVRNGTCLKCDNCGSTTGCS